MISVENLYWVLYDNLLHPVNLDCRYFYPFGTTDTLVTDEFNPRRRRFGTSQIAPMVLFHYDQEPIYPEDRNTILDATNGNYHKWPRLLANSERSRLKKEICQEYRLLDWYFFYHGFAALNWLRDAQYINSDEQIYKPFSSLNHLVTGKRSYRMALTARLHEMEVLTQGDVSFHADFEHCEKEIADPQCLLSDKSKQLIYTNIISKKRSRVILDDSAVDGSWSARYGVHEHRLRQRSLFHLVNETVFFDQKLHLTEKIFQPIVSLRPFIMVSAPGNLEYLKSYGFKTFDRWIDESYDKVLDHDQRLDMIAAEVARLSAQPLDRLRAMKDDMLTTLIYNKNHFFGDFKRIIVEELVDNFDACIGIWNNGRIDGRSWPRLPDIAKVKNLLCQRI